MEETVDLCLGENATINKVAEQIKNILNNEKNCHINNDNIKLIKHISVNGGKLVVSVQASEHHYCTPRQKWGNYIEVEVGYPSTPPPRYIQKFVTDNDSSIFAYVPIKLLAKWLISLTK